MVRDQRSKGTQKGMPNRHTGNPLKEGETSRVYEVKMSRQLSWVKGRNRTPAFLYQTLSETNHMSSSSYLRVKEVTGGVYVSNPHTEASGTNLRIGARSK